MCRLSIVKCTNIGYFDRIASSIKCKTPHAHQVSTHGKDPKPCHEDRVISKIAQQYPTASCITRISARPSRSPLTQQSRRDTTPRVVRLTLTVSLSSNHFGKTPPRSSPWSARYLNNIHILPKRKSADRIKSRKSDASSPIDLAPFERMCATQERSKFMSSGRF